MIVTSILNKGDKPSDEQIQAIRKAKERPITFDEDSPEMSDKMRDAFIKAAIRRNRK